MGCKVFSIKLWWHGVQTIFPLQILCEGNPLITDIFAPQRPDVGIFHTFVVSSNKLLKKNSLVSGDLKIVSFMWYHGYAISAIVTWNKCNTWLCKATLCTEYGFCKATEKIHLCVINQGEIWLTGNTYWQNRVLAKSIYFKLASC